MYQETLDEDGALFPDGPRYGYDGEGRRTGANYSSRDELEFFAQLTNVYFRANRGKDPYTGESRHNGGPDWVRRHYPALFPLTQRLYGADPEAVYAGTVNPVDATQAENEIWEGFRALWDEAEGTHVPQPHTPAPVPAPPVRPAGGITDAPAAPPNTDGATSAKGNEPAAAPQTQQTSPPASGELSEYIQSQGTQYDGHLGLVLHEPTPDPVLDGLYRQIIEALGVEPDSADGRALRTRLSEVLSAEEIERHRPYLRSTQGHRITVQVGDRERTVDVRLAYADIRKSTKYGRTPASLPDVQVERRAEGSQSSSDAEGSGNVRSGSLPWTAVYPHDGGGALRWWDGTVTLSATHNQLAQSVTVGETFLVTSKQHAKDPAHPVDFDGRWQVRVDTPREDLTANWQPEQSHGTLTAWHPEHLAFGDTDSADLPEPGGVDDLPLWGVDSVAEPRRLLTELLQDERFADLTAQERALEDFLSEQMLKGTAHLQRDGGVYSATLLDEDGNAVGMVKLAARIEPGQPTRKSADGKFSLETWLTHASNVDRSARFTSGIGIEGSGGPTFTTDHAAGHPRGPASFGGNLMGKAGVNWQVNEGLNTASSATLMHGVYTGSSHLLTPSRVTYDVTFYRAGGGEVTGSFGPWEDGLRLRIAQRATMAGHRPGPDEVRELPEHLENLESIGYSETPFKVEGADPLFARAEAWLRQEGFLPPAEPRRRSFPFRLDEPLVLAQLENLRRLGRMRSQFALATSAPDEVDGGHPEWFERPNAVTGTRRVQLRFSITRDTGRHSEHTRRLPDVHQVGFSSYESSGGRQRGTALGGAVGGGGGFNIPLADGDWTLNTGPDYTGTVQLSDSVSTGDAVGLDQFVMATENGSEVFRVPARLALDLYEGDDDAPRIRFADDDTAPADADGRTDTAGPADVVELRDRGATPHTVPGSVSLLVPHYRTHQPRRSLVPAAPRPGHLIREPVTDGGPTDDYRRLDMVDGQGRPLPGLTRLPDGAVVDTFRATAALMEALGQIVAGTYPGHPEQGPLGRAVRRASETLTDLATSASRRGSAVKEALPASLTGAVNRVGTAVSWAATPVTWAAQASATGAVATYKWTSVAVAGAALNDQGTLAAETRHDGIRPAQLLSRAWQVLGGVHVVEGLTLPGMAADQVMMVEISGYLTNPRQLGSESLYSEQDLTAADTAGRQRGVGGAHQGNFQLTALQTAPTVPDRLVHQFNPSGRYTHSRRTDDTGALSSGTKITSIPSEKGDQLWIGNDLTLVVTVKWGMRNVAGNTVGLGSYAPVTVAIDLPRAVTYLAPAQALARLAAWFQGIPGIPSLTPPGPGVPLPDRFARTRQLGAAVVLSVTQLDDTTNRRERRDRLGRELTALVENEAPGVTRPGHASYLSGVETEIARHTEPSALRALPGRGPAGYVRFHFLHVAYGAARLVEVTLRAEPYLQTPALRGVRGRPAGEGSGLEQTDSHTPENKAKSSTVTTTRQTAVNPVSRYPRPGYTGRTDREGPSVALTETRSRTRRSEVTGDDRFQIRSGSAADFDIDYRFTASVRSQLIWEWPANIPGGIFQGGLLNLSGLEGDVAERVRTWVRRLLRGRPEGLATVPVATVLRFVGSEAVRPRQHAGPRPPALLTQDPLEMSPQQARAQGTLPFSGGSQLVPTGTTPVYDYNAVPQLRQALHDVAPRTTASWGLPANASAEATATRLGELIQAGDISLDPPRTAAGLTTTMPGSWPLQGPGSAPSLQITLHNPRPVTDAGDVAVDRIRKQGRTSSTTSSAGSSFALNQQGTYSLKSGNVQLLSLGFPLAAQQPHTTSSGGGASAAGLNRMRIGNTTEPDDRHGTRGYETLVDTVTTVSGPEGTRYVTGSSTARLWERDVLGFGITPPRPGPGIYDLPAMLAHQDADDLRDWARHPVTDLPQTLTDGIDEADESAQLWLALGADPDGTRLARALFVASRTAALSGKPVELVVRAEEGLRHWPFAADGSLADMTEATRDTWERIQGAIDTYLDAVRAEATARHREDGLVRRQRGAARALETTGRAVDTATTAHQGADRTHGDAVRSALAIRTVLGRVRTEIREAEKELASLEKAARDAQARYDAAPEAERRMREEWQQAQAEVERIEQLIATSPAADPAVAAEPRSTLAEAQERATTAHERVLAAPRQRQQYYTAMTTARESADELGTTLEGTRERESTLTQDLERAEGAVDRAEQRLEQAVRELTRRTRARDAVQVQVRGIERDLNDVRQELERQARRHTEAWGGLPGLAGRLDTGRRAEGTGEGPSLLGSLSSAPARSLRSGLAGTDEPSLFSPPPARPFPRPRCPLPLPRPRRGLSPVRPIRCCPRGLGWRVRRMRGRGGTGRASR
ncbi:hypothetical protein SAZ11_15470 [Streptomyces sp. FXJ1.4098]|nr:hypothetical protein [Streptomyces sp. FXJ1.4098]